MDYCMKGDMNKRELVVMRLIKAMDVAREEKREADDAKVRRLRALRRIIYSTAVVLLTTLLLVQVCGLLLLARCVPQVS